MKFVSLHLILIFIILFLSGCKENKNDHHRYDICYSSLGRSSGERVEKEVTVSVEKIVGTLSGVEEVRSVTNHDFALISVGIVGTSKPEQVLKVIQNKLTLNKSVLPQDVAEPTVVHVSGAATSDAMCKQVPGKRV